MIDINIAELTARTREAIAEGKRKAAADELLKQRKAAAEAEKARLKAKHIIEQIPLRCQQEAAAERNHAEVMSLDYGEYRDNNDRYSQPDPTAIKTKNGPQIVGAAAKIVWEFCVDAGLEPTLEYWHDGVGIKGGYNIVVHWPK